MLPFRRWLRWTRVSGVGEGEWGSGRRACVAVASSAGQRPTRVALRPPCSRQVPFAVRVLGCALSSPPVPPRGVVGVAPRTGRLQASGFGIGLAAGVGVRDRVGCGRWLLEGLAGPLAVHLPWA